MAAAALVAVAAPGCGQRSGGDDERAWITTDELVTTLTDFRGELHLTREMPRTERARVAAAALQRAAVHDAVHARHGNLYHHHAYDAPAGCLEAGVCFRNYVAFQARQLELEFADVGSRTPEPGRVAALAAMGDELEIERELQARISEAARLVETLAPTWRGAVEAPHRVWLIDSGHPADARRDAAVARALEAHPGKLRVTAVPLGAAPRLPALLGRRLMAAALVDGELRQNLVTLEQWTELAMPDGALPASTRRHADLPIFDAHAHVVGAGRDRFQRILADNEVTAAVTTPLPRDPGYGGLAEANARILAEAPGYDRTVLPFVMLDPGAPAPRATLEAFIARGARGVKLIDGHGSYHDASGLPLDSPGMREVFGFCQERRIPVLWHVNTHLFGAGFLRVLSDYPRLQVVSPHLAGYLTYAPEILRQLLDRYPNLSVDLSFGGQPAYLRRSFEDLSIKRDAWRQLIIDHPTRFLFGVDLVVSESTSRAHARMLYRLYTAMLEEETFVLEYFPARGYGLISDEGHYRPHLRGLALPAEVLRKVYWDNAARLYGER